MTNSALQIKIKERLNKLASLDFDNIECWQIQEAFNKAQLDWVRKQMYGLNIRREGVEQSSGLVDDLQILLQKVELKLSKKELYYQGQIPKDYLYLSRLDVSAFTECCPPKMMTMFQTEETNIGVVLNDDLKGPSFEWAESVYTLSGNKVLIYTNNKFSIEEASLIYYRLPKEIKIEGCVDINTGTVNTVNQNCEFKDDIAEILVDLAAQYIAGDIESITQFQRQQQVVQERS